MPTVDGLISGLDTSSIIKELLFFQRQPIVRLQGKVVTTTEKKTALAGLTAKLLALQGSLNGLGRTESFNPLSVSSSNESVLTATAGEGLTAGTYRFRVARLAQSEQYVSAGFAEQRSVVGEGTLSVETGNGFVDRDTELGLLNGGRGVSRGAVRITNRLGASAVVDLSSALTVDDVIEKINSIAGLNVTARLATSGDDNPREALVLEDASSGTGQLTVQEVSGGSTARDLGILSSVDSATLQGTAILGLGDDLRLDFLNDNLGVRTATGGDLLVTQRDGTSFEVDLTGAVNVGDVLRLVNEAAGNTGVTATVSGSRFVLTDTSGAGGSLSVQSLGGGAAAEDLGLSSGSSAGQTLTGERVLADLNSVLLKTLNGGYGSASPGVEGGTIRITDRSGTAAVIDLQGLETLQEVLDTINFSAIGVRASFGSSGTGIELRDTSGGSGLLRVEQVSAGTTAADLGILEEGGISSSVLRGTDLDPQYVGFNTRLSTLNGGTGVAGGKIRITDGDGQSFVVDLGQEKTIGEVLRDINSAPANASITASINETGNGILLVGASGTGNLRVEEVDGGTTAADLNLLGTANDARPLVIDGSFERAIQIDAGDTLEEVVQAINDLGIRVQASIVNDGSSVNPFRLQISGTTTGAASRVLLDTAGDVDLSFSRTSAARDSVLFYGSTENGSQPIVARSSTTSFSDIVNGLDLTVLDTSESEVVVTARPDSTKVKETISGFVDAYNSVIQSIDELTKFDASLDVRGTLFGEGITRTIQRQISSALSRRVVGLPAGKNLASSIGIRLQANGTLAFDEARFDALAAIDPDAPERIFNQKRLLDLDTPLEDFGNGSGVDDRAGADFEITTRDGSSFEVDLTGDRTVRDVLRSIETAAGNDGRVTAELSTDGRALVLKDSTAGTTTFRVESVDSSSVPAQIGLLGAADSSGGGTITGEPVDLDQDRGVALRLLEALDTLLDTESGAVTLRSNFYQRSIDDLEERIAEKEEILKLREETLLRQFSQLESLIAGNQNAVARLNASLGNLTNLSL